MVSWIHLGNDGDKWVSGRNRGQKRSLNLFSNVYQESDCTYTSYTDDFLPSRLHFFFVLLRLRHRDLIAFVSTIFRCSNVRPTWYYRPHSFQSGRENQCSVLPFHYIYVQVRRWFAPLTFRISFTSIFARFSLTFFLYCLFARRLYYIISNKPASVWSSGIYTANILHVSTL